MQVIVRLRPSKMTAEEKAAEAEANKKATFFLPLHQRLELEKLGHATGLEAEVHAKMNTGGGKSLEEQKASRDGTSDQPASAPKTGAGLEAAKAAKKSKGGNKKVTNDQLIAIMAEGLDEEAKIVDVPEVKKDRRIDMAEFLEGYGRVTGYNFVAFSGIKVNGCWGPGCGAATIISARASEG